MPRALVSSKYDPSERTDSYPSRDTNKETTRDAATQSERLFSVEGKWQRTQNNMTAKEELKALAVECLETNDSDRDRAIEEFTEIIEKRPDLLEALTEEFLGRVLLVSPGLLSLYDPPDKLQEARPKARPGEALIL